MKNKLDSRSGNDFGNVVEDVVSALVAEDEEDFVVRNAAGGRVPHNDAFGSANTADVGVEAVGLDAGLHEEHAVRRDVGAGAGDNLFKLGDEAGVISCEAVRTC